MVQLTFGIMQRLSPLRLVIVSATRYHYIKRTRSPYCVLSSIGSGVSSGNSEQHARIEQRSDTLSNSLVVVARKPYKKLRAVLLGNCTPGHRAWQLLDARDY